MELLRVLYLTKKNKNSVINLNYNILTNFYRYLSFVLPSLDRKIREDCIARDSYRVN